MTTRPDLPVSAVLRGLVASSGDRVIVGIANKYTLTFPKMQATCQQAESMFKRFNIIPIQNRAIGNA